MNRLIHQDVLLKIFSLNTFMTILALHVALFALLEMKVQKIILIHNTAKITFSLIGLTRIRVFSFLGFMKFVLATLANQNLKITIY